MIVCVCGVTPATQPIKAVCLPPVSSPVPPHLLCLLENPLCPLATFTLYLPHFLFSGSQCVAETHPMTAKETEGAHGHRGGPTFASQPKLLLESDISFAWTDDAFTYTSM